MAKTSKGRADATPRSRAVRRSAQAWAKEVAEWRRSGESAASYAAARGIRKATLLWWSSAAGTQAIERATPAAGPERARRARRNPQEHAFVPIRVAAPPADDLRLEAEVVLAGGRRVRLVGALSPSQIGQLIDAIEGGSTC